MLFVECVEEGGPIDLSGADDCFGSPCAGLIGYEGVFDVDLEDVWGEECEGFDGIAHVVEDHVGRIEVDAERGVVQFIDGFEESLGGFLSSLEGDVDSPFGEDVDDLAEALDHDRACWIVRFVWDEAGVECDEWDAEFGGEPGVGFGGFEVVPPVFIESDSACFFDGVECCVIFTLHGHHAGGDEDTGFFERFLCGFQ